MVLLLVYLTALTHRALVQLVRLALVWTSVRLSTPSRTRYYSVETFIASIRVTRLSLLVCTALSYY